MAEHSEAQTSRIAEAVTHQLEREMAAAGTSIATTVEAQMRTAVEGMHRDVQAQIKQNRVDAERRDEDTQK